MNKIYRLYCLAALDAFKGKEMPEWLKEHKVFKDKKNIKKVFPSVGIKNFVDPVEFEAAPQEHKAFAIVGNILEDMRDGLTSATRQYNELDNLSIDAQSKINNLNAIVDILYIYGSNPKNLTETLPDGRVRIVLYKPINDATGKVFGRKGEPLFRVYEKIRLLIQ